MTLNESDLLDLPDAPDFISLPPEITHEQMIHLVEKMLVHINQQRLEKPPPPFVGEEFVLHD